MLARVCLLALVLALLGASAAPADDDDGTAAPAPAAETTSDGDAPEDGFDERETWDYDTRAPEAAWPAAIGLPDAHDEGGRGAGVTVAVLDTGVSERHPDLAGRVAARVDMTPDADGYDRHGHGAHMTGLVAGDGAASGGRHAGAAPEAAIVSVKVAGPDGATDVSTVLAGLEWIAAHKDAYGIDVVSLSYGSDASQEVEKDPLNFAVQRLTRMGVVVVVAAGNRGAGGANLDKPADDPSVITVGAADVRGTADTADDVVAPFSSHGPSRAGDPKPDLVAPGISLVSHRAADSMADAMRPEARIDAHYFKGSGTSQATALVAGIAALVLAEDPTLTPADVKATLVGTADPALRGQGGAGAGLVDAAAAVDAAGEGDVPAGPTPAARPSTGTGSLDASRGSFRPFAAWRSDRPEELSGEFDPLGNPWDGAAWAARPWTPAGWSTSPWAPVTTVAPQWDDAPAPARTWPGMSVMAETWNMRRWGGQGWSMRRWGSEYWTMRRWGSDAWHGLG